MAVTETVTEGWGSRLGGSVRGILVGLAMFVAGFPVLFWNEGNTVKTRKALEEGEGACICLESPDTIEAEMNGKLVHISGMADTQDILTDPVFGVSERAIRLERNVEMFQWMEESRTSEKKNLGGSVTKTTTYTYSKVWADHYIDSNGFKEPGHDNPGGMEFTQEKSIAANVTFGAFRLSKDQITSIGDEQHYVFPTNYVCPIERVKVAGATIYVPDAETRSNALNNRDVVSQPRIGDMRVTFEIIRPHEISLVAKQHGDTFVPYVAKNKKKVSLLADGIKDAAEMFADAQSANDMMCWLIRLAGFLLMFFGIRAVVKPISVVLDVLPILGDIAEIGLGVVAFAVAAPCALVTIAVAWLFYRPIAACILIAISGGIVYLFIKKRNEKRAAKAAAAAAGAIPSPEAK